jgi:hypothetical protein
MTSRGRFITLEGAFANDVLGTFRVVRGFADLRDLALVSVPYLLESADSRGRVHGVQRTVDNDHAESIRDYLEFGHQRFLPEIIISLRTPVSEMFDGKSRVTGVVSVDDSNGVAVSKKSSSHLNSLHEIKVDLHKLEEIRSNRLIRRVDGNHRLALADQLQDDAQVANKYLAPFCLILLGATSDDADDYSESLIFHTINSTALPLESEHALRLILGQDPLNSMSPDDEFKFNPRLHVTRILRDGFQGLPEQARRRVGTRPLTSLNSVARTLLEMSDFSLQSRDESEVIAREFIAVVNDVFTSCYRGRANVFQKEYFLELVARVWFTREKSDEFDKRAEDTIAEVSNIADWMEKLGISSLSSDASFCQQLIDVFGAVKRRLPKKMFLARWYPTPEDGMELQRAELRLNQIQETLNSLARNDAVAIELIDVGTQTGGTFQIQQRIFSSIESSDLVLIDFTGVRPNVCVEAGYALDRHEKDRLIFLFQATAAHPRVPFDLAGFRFEMINEAAEIPAKLLPHIKEIVQESKS